MIKPVIAFIKVFLLYLASKKLEKYTIPISGTYVIREDAASAKAAEADTLFPLIQR